MSREIERKFLVKELPQNLDGFKSKKIMQGYLNIENRDIEVRFRKKGKRYFQTIKKGNGLNREESEVELTKEQFITFWPLTINHRIVKRRYKIPYDNYIIELDIYKNKYNGLIACEVEFPNEKEAHDFVPPEWFGIEVTNEFALQNNNVALYGINEDLFQKYQIELKGKNKYLQSGVIPIRNNNEVLIITTSKKKWIFPKGIIEQNLTSEESAKKEAYEEAGIQGDIGEKFGEFNYKKWNGICNVELFLLENIIELDEWPENFRQRKWVKINELSLYVKKKRLQPIINKLKEKYK